MKATVNISAVNKVNSKLEINILLLICPKPTFKQVEQKTAVIHVACQFKIKV